MALLIGLGDFGLGDMMQKVQDLYNLLLDLCQDQLAWENVINKPTTLAGFGITDAYTQNQIATLLEGYAEKIHSHTFASLTEKPTTLAGFGVTDAYTTEQVDDFLDKKSNLNHTHSLEDIIDVQDIFDLLKFSIITELPSSPTPETLQFVRNSGAAKVTMFLIDASGNPVEMDYVNYQTFTTSLAGKQNKLSGPTSHYTRGDGSTALLNKAAVGLGNIPNLPPNEWPIPDEQAIINSQKANDYDVLKKTGNQVKTSGTLTFMESPEVPVATQPGQAINFGQVQTLISEETDGKSYVEIFGNGTDSSYTIEHGLGTKAIVPSFFNLLTGKVVHLGAEFPDDDTIVVTTSKPAAVNKYQLTLIRQW